MFQKPKVKDKVTLINYLITYGFLIPHFCYHANLSVDGNCRVCVIELENSVKPMMSCAVNAKAIFNNNNVFVGSIFLKKARENLLEFLLLNHPLDCPICDQGGDCDLQDQALIFGIFKRRFHKLKRIVYDKNMGSMIKTVMSRCIHCSRCVRFANEIAGVGHLGILKRGVSSEIGNYLNNFLFSELSTNIVDICPVSTHNRIVTYIYYLLNSQIFLPDSSFTWPWLVFLGDNYVNILSGVVIALFALFAHRNPPEQSFNISFDFKLESVRAEYCFPTILSGWDDVKPQVQKLVGKHAKKGYKQVKFIIPEKCLIKVFVLNKLDTFRISLKRKGSSTILKKMVVHPKNGIANARFESLPTGVYYLRVESRTAVETICLYCINLKTLKRF